MRCTLEVRKFQARGAKIAKFLQPLLPPEQHLYCFPQFLDRQVVLIPQLGFDPSRFATRVPRVRASYIERWDATDGFERQFGLERAYLHLYLKEDKLQERELVLLHCDPNMPRSEAHYQYKAGPHLHMSTAEDPMPHCHVGLYNDQVDQVLASVDKLTVALCSVIKMLNDQVLDRFV